MKRIILLLIIIVVLAAAWYGYKLYTGKVKSLTEVKADTTIMAGDLITAFELYDKVQYDFSGKKGKH